MHLSPDVAKLNKYLTETLDLIVPVMESASSPKLAKALVAVLHDAIRAACRAQRQPIPHAAAHVNASLVGASSHTEAQLHEINDEAAFGGGEGAVVEGADLVAVGPVYASSTKSGHAPVVGLEALERRCRISKLPVVAIGGITSPARAAECARAGAHLAAAVSALDGPDARVIARRMSLAFVAARSSR
jgi:thiamine monophosphate synthase